MRERELKSLIDEFFQGREMMSETLQFPEWLSLDEEKLTVSGHSFGGMTALRLAQTDTRVKAVLTIDPWLYPVNKEVMDGSFKISVPHATVVSEYFP